MEVKVSDPDLDPDPVRIWRFCLDPDTVHLGPDPKPWCYFPEEIMTDQPTDKIRVHWEVKLPINYTHTKQT